MIHSNYKDVFWKIYNFDYCIDIIFKGKYSEALEYSKTLYIKNPQIIPIDYNQISNKDKIIIKSISVESPRLNQQTNINKNYSNELNKRIILPKLSLDKIDNLKNIPIITNNDELDKFEIIDAKSARQITNSNYYNYDKIKLICQKIKERANKGYSEITIDLDDLLSPTNYNHKYILRNLDSSPSNCIIPKTSTNEIKKISEYFEQLGYNTQLDINHLIISWKDIMTSNI